MNIRQKGWFEMKKNISQIYLYLANACLGVSIAALTMAEFNLSGSFGHWHPTYETAIAYGVLSFALSNIGNNLTNKNRS